VLDNGRVAISGRAAELAGWSGVKEIYLGGSAHLAEARRPP
jgi:hypothetical protein